MTSAALAPAVSHTSRGAARPTALQRQPKLHTLACFVTASCNALICLLPPLTPLPPRWPSLLLVRRARQHKKQPRGRRFAPIISEYSHTVSVQAPCPPTLDHKNCLTALWHNIPSGSKLLRVSVERGGKDTRASLSQRLEEGDTPEQAERFFVFGVYRPPETFLREACLLKHPFDVARALPDCIMVKACSRFWWKGQRVSFAPAWRNSNFGVPGLRSLPPPRQSLEKTWRRP